MTKQVTPRTPQDRIDYLLSKDTLTIRTAFKHYKIMYPESKINLASFQKICQLFNQKIANYLLEGYEIKLPHRMGIMAVQGKKRRLTFDRVKNPKGLMIDKHKSAKYGKVIYHTNEHSDGIVYEGKWLHKEATSKNKQVYAFELVRQVKRKLGEKIMNGKTYFYKHQKLKK